MELYDVLGLDPGASEEQVKRAYRQEALRYHPDKNPPEEREACEIRFKRVAEAYQILSDPVKRAQYDVESRRPSSSSLFGMGGGFQSPFDLFESFFGSNGNPFDDPFFTQRLPSSFFGSARDPFDDPFFTQTGRHMRSNDPFAQVDRFFGHAPMISSSSSSVNAGRHHHHRGGRMATSTSTSSRTRIVNGHRETVTEVRDRQGNVRVETETVDPAGRLEKRVMLNGIEQQPSATPRGRRIHIS